MLITCPPTPEWRKAPEEADMSRHGQPGDPERAAGKEGAAHAMTVSTKAHSDLCGLHKHSPLTHPFIQSFLIV